MSKNKGKSIRRENLEATIKKQKATTAKALEVVEKLIEKNVTEQVLLQSVRHLNQASYQDVIDERSILHFCGYPLCNKKLENIRKQQYKITRTNGTLLLYDTTERKKFCSNICYKSDKYLKDQLPSCPLWLIQPKDVETVKLLKNDNCQLVGSHGEKVNFESSEFRDSFHSLSTPETTNKNNTKSTEKKCLNDCGNSKAFVEEASDDDDKTFRDISSGSDADDDFKDAVDNDVRLKTDNSKDNVNSYSDCRTDSELLETNPIEKLESADIECDVRVSKFLEDGTDNYDIVNSNNSSIFVSDKVNDNKSNVICSDNNSALESSIINKKDYIKYESKADKNVNELAKKTVSSVANRKNKTKRPEIKEKSDVSPILASVLRIEQCIREWVSLDTLTFLLGEDRLKTIIDETCGIEKFKTRIESKVQVEKYLAICRKLNLLEIQESKLDNSCREDSGKKTVGPTQPVPDYETLKQEAKEMEIRVRAFYRGDKQVQFDNVADSGKSDDNSVSIPLVDQHAQKYLRRKIVLDHLHRVFPDLLRALNLSKSNSSIILKVKHLVETLTLSAHNIMFRPAEWHFIGIVIIKLLSIQDEMLNAMISTEKCEKYFTLVLMSYEQDSGYLNRLITWLLYEHSLFIT